MQLQTQTENFSLKIEQAQSSRNVLIQQEDWI